MSSKQTKNTKVLNGFLKDQKGMTLVDLSIAMVLLGILITPVLYQLKEMKYQQAIDEQNENMGTIENAIERYFLANGFYPCPADPTLARNNALHGSAATLAATPTACAQTPAGALVAEGSVPHTELGISIDDTYDGYGNKITYAVTDALASNAADGAPAGPPPAGAITINHIPLVPDPTTFGLASVGDDICADTITPYPPSPLPLGALPEDYPPIANSGIHYTLFSHGNDGVGAFNAQGVQIAACNAGATADSENCDLALDDGAAALYLTEQCRANSTSTAMRFDDALIANATASSKMGVPDDIFSNIIGVDNDVKTNVQLIGVNNPAADHPLDVIGNLKSTSDILDATLTGVSKSGAFCNDAGECFTSSVIGGSDPNMQCASGKAFEEISGNSARCESRVHSVTTATTCPPGQYVVSISGVTGAAICG